VGPRIAHTCRLGIKELRSLRADPVLILLIIFAFTVAVYAVATGAKLEVANAAVGIVDEDHSELSRLIRSAILPPLFRAPVDLAAPAVGRAMDRGQFVFVLDIPPEFESDLLAGRAPSLQIDVDATAMTEAGNGALYLQNIVTQEILSFTRRDEGTVALPINVVITTRFNPNADSEWFTSVMQVINNITILSVILTGAALIREREQGTIEHLLVMPVSSSEIMLAKIWANGLVIVVAALLSLLLVVRLLLQVPIAGSLTLFVAATVLYELAVTALGILLATFVTSMAQFGLLVIPVLVAMNLLSGSTTPMESMPSWLQRVMQVSPATHFVALSQAILYRGAGLGIVWPQLLIISAISAICFAVSLKRFRRSIVASQ
jgi:ABC-2 type transport system permease protein